MYLPNFMVSAPQTLRFCVQDKIVRHGGARGKVTKS